MLLLKNKYTLKNTCLAYDPGIFPSRRTLRKSGLLHKLKIEIAERYCPHLHEAYIGRNAEIWQRITNVLNFVAPIKNFCNRHRDSQLIKGLNFYVFFIFPDIAKPNDINKNIVGHFKKLR